MPKVAALDPAKVVEKIQKPRLQYSFREAAVKIYTNEGPKGFTRGLMPAVLKNSLLTGQFFSVLFYMEQFLGRFSFLREGQVQSLSGMMAKAMNTTIGNPITVIKTRFEVVGFNQYSGILDASRKIYTSEGIGGFFQGLKVSLIRDVPFSGIFYPIYMFFRTNMMQLYQQDLEQSRSTA